MMIVGSQLIAFPLTVPISPLNRFRISPFEYLFRDSQSASTILSKISAWMSLLISMLSFAVIRLMMLLNARLNTVLPTMTAIMTHSLLVSYPVMISIIYLLATLLTSPIEVLKIPRIT